MRKLEKSVSAFLLPRSHPLRTRWGLGGLRIAFFSWETKNSIPVGGVAAVVTQLSEALAVLGHEVHVFTRISEGKLEHEKINGVYEHRCVTPACEDFIEYMDHFCDSAVSCFHWAERTYGRFDIIHSHDWHTVNAAANLKHMSGRRFVWTCHSTEYGRNGNAHHDNWWTGRITHREWLGGYLSSAVTTVSHAMRQELSNEYRIPWDKMNVIYNGIDLSRFGGFVDAGRVKEKYHIHPLAPVIFFIGRLTHQKGPDLLLEAVPYVLARRPDAKFIFAGSGDMTGHIHGRGRYLGVEHSLRVLGYISDEERVRLFKACDIVCVPSRNEPFGIVTLEGWAAGKPVVACDTGGPGEIIDNFRTGVKVYQTPESIAWGINYLLGDDGTGIRQMGANAKKEVEKYDWKEIAKQYLKVYEKVASLS
ncbi:Trehalose synthase [uncultured archaeon]|nr:Trehalose synthase [uncultured archaeon]